MNKKLIAVAVAGLVSGAAFAQSNVTVYGLVDVGFEYAKGDDATGRSLKSTGINSGPYAGSRLGFKGEEALGNGLKANFVLEYGLGVDRNRGINGARQQYVGLSGDFGSITAGFLYPPGADYGWKYDVTGAANAFSMPQAFGQNDTFTKSVSTLFTGAHQNAVRYDAPVYKGFSFKFAYAFAGDFASGNLDTTPFKNDQERFYNLGLDYDNGPLSIGLNYARTNDVDAFNGNTREYGIAALYNFDVVQVLGRVDKFKQSIIGTIDDVDKRMTTVGVAIPFGARKLSVHFTSLKDDEHNAADSRGYGVLYEHPLSKRTMLYAGVAHTSNDRNAHVAVPTGNGNGVDGPFTFGTLGNGESSTGYAFGTVHTF